MEYVLSERRNQNFKISFIYENIKKQYTKHIDFSKKI